MPPSLSRILKFGYFQQLIALGSMLGFNLLIPIVTGLSTFGQFTAAFGIVMLVVGIAGSGLDLVLARDICLGDGTVRRAFFWRALTARIVICVSLGAVLVIPGAPFEAIPNRSGVSIGVILLTIAAVASSAHCISTIIGVRATRHAVLLSAVHVFPYFLFPLALWSREGGSNAGSLMEGLLLSYVLIIAAEAAVLWRLPWADAEATPPTMQILKASVSLSPISLFDALRTWGTVLIASLWLTAADLAVARTSFSIAAAMVTLVPVPMQALLALGANLHDLYTSNRRLSDVVRHTTCLTTLGTGLAIVVYGGLMPDQSASVYATCAAATMLITATGPLTKLSLAFAAASASWRNLLLVMGSLLLALPSAAIGAVTLGPRGVLIGIAISSIPLFFIPPSKLRNSIARRVDVAYLAVGIALSLLLAHAPASLRWHAISACGLIAVYVAINFKVLTGLRIS